MKSTILAKLLGFALVTLCVPTLAFAQSSGKAPIKIGGSLPMTGAWAEQAKWISRGYNAWVEEVNKSGGLLGRPVELVIYDDEAVPAKAVTFYERAITIDRVDLLAGGYPGGTNAVIMPLAEKYRKLFVSMGAHMASFSQGYRFSFGSPPLMADWAGIAMAGILDDLVPADAKPKTAALLTMNNVVGQSERKVILPVLEKHGIKVVVDEVYNLPLTDANPLVAKARGQNAELLVNCSNFDDDVMIIRAAIATNYNPKLIFHQLAPALPAWMAELGNDGNVGITFHWWNSKLTYPGNDKINQYARELYGVPEAPTYFGFGYAWMKTLQTAVEATKSLDDVVLRDYMRKATFDFPYGTGIKFDEKGLPQPFTIVTMTQNGKNEIIWPVNQATAKLVYPKPAWTKK